jgi:hypothetical protein
VVDHGGTTQISGALYDSRDPLHEVGMGGRSLTLRSAGSATGPWNALETLTTSSAAGSIGTCTATVAPLRPTYYQLRYAAPAGSDYGSSLSYVIRVGVRPVLGKPVVPSSARAGRRFTVSGTVSPQFPAGVKTVTIDVYRVRNGRLVLTKKAAATNKAWRDDTKYGVGLRLSKGTYRFRASTAATAAWAASTSGLSKVLIVR